MKKLMKLFAVAPLALALVFGGLVAADSDSADGDSAKPAKGGENITTAEEESKPGEAEDATALKESEQKQTDWDVTLVDNMTNKIINKKGGLRIEKGYSSAELAKKEAAKLYASPEVVRMHFAAKKYAGAKVVKVESDTANHKIQLYYEPTQEQLLVKHQLLLCDGKADLNQPILVETQWVPFKTDFENVELKKLPYSVLNQVSTKAWTLVSIKYNNGFNDSPVVKYVDLSTGKVVGLRNLDKKGSLLLSYKPSTCAKNADKKVDAATDEEKKEEKKDDAKQDEKKSLPATGSSSNVLVFLSAAVLLGAGLVLVKKH